MNNMTIAQALQRARQIELNMKAFEQTAPKTVAALGGSDALAHASEMTCIGPIPRLDVSTWARLSAEYEDMRKYGGTGNHGS
ncbi:hypothetical protein NX784_11035 [Massilia pinisoli]|jgi:hypothetical protein|uniref:Uncharacterized protein n=1 Tax=Massilia pinisoli TaxID=1772194 RepID=A0ABT1ZQC6_9BURK|nr:hypothetical protein [Massilia pinisoli]MCS0582126.1 hypothetical protein [Massilia pinisoli]